MFLKIINRKYLACLNLHGFQRSYLETNFFLLLKVFILFSILRCFLFATGLTGAPCVLPDTSSLASLGGPPATPSVGAGGALQMSMTPAPHAQQPNLALQLATSHQLNPNQATLQPLFAPQPVPGTGQTAFLVPGTPSGASGGAAVAAALNIPNSNPLVDQLLVNAAQAYHTQLALNS